MPVSTEQILRPDRYAMGDQPVNVTFTGPPRDTVRYEDGLGELEIRLLFQQLMHDTMGDRATPLAQGWGGDRYQVLGADTRVIRISVPVSSVAEHVVRLRAPVLAGLVAAMALGVGVAWLLSGVMVRRIQRLVRFAASLA